MLQMVREPSGPSFETPLSRLLRMRAAGDGANGQALLIATAAKALR
jgi:hypothetical protein